MEYSAASSAAPFTRGDARGDAKADEIGSTVDAVVVPANNRPLLVNFIGNESTPPVVITKANMRVKREKT